MSINQSKRNVNSELQNWLVGNRWYVIPTSSSPGPGGRHKNFLPHKRHFNDPQRLLARFSQALGSRPALWRSNIFEADPYGSSVCFSQLRKHREVGERCCRWGRNRCPPPHRGACFILIIRRLLWPATTNSGPETVIIIIVTLCSWYQLRVRMCKEISHLALFRDWGPIRRKGLFPQVEPP